MGIENFLKTMAGEMSRSMNTFNRMRMKGDTLKNLGRYFGQTGRFLGGSGAQWRSFGREMWSPGGAGPSAGRLGTLRGAASNWWHGGNLMTGGKNTYRATMRQGMVYGAGAAVGLGVGSSLINGGRRRRY